MFVKKREMTKTIFILLLISCLSYSSCSYPKQVFSEEEFQTSLFSEFGVPQEIDTSYLDIEKSRIRYISYMYREIESPKHDIVYNFNNYINAILVLSESTLKDGLPAYYDARWGSYDLGFEVHLTGSRPKKSILYDVCVQTISSSPITPSSQTPQTVAPSK